MSEHVPCTDHDTRLAAYPTVVDRHDRILLAPGNEGAERECRTRA